MSKTPELESSPVKIDKIVNRIDSGDIRIPAFQRAFVWKQNQVIELLESIVNNFPIGSILLWYTTERLKHTRNIAGYFIPENAIEYPVNYVLDGQQRVSSIYAVFSDKVIQDITSERYNPNLDIFEIYYDFKSKVFLSKNEVDETVDSVTHVRNLFSTKRLLHKMKTLNSAYHDEANDLCSCFLNYEIPVVTIRNRSKEEVGVIFERINNTGTRLNTVDLMTAWTWTDDFHLLEAIDGLTRELKSKGFGGISYNILLQALSAVIQNDTTTSAVLSLTGEKIRDNWEHFCETLRKSIDFLSTELKCYNSDFLPFIQQIVPLTKFFSIENRDKIEQVEWLKKWFWRTSFSHRYSSGTTTAKMNYDIEIMLQFKNDNFSRIDDYQTSISSMDLFYTNFSKSNPLTRAFLLLMAQYNPLDLTNGKVIDLDKSLSKYNRKEYHHVYPNAFLKGKGYSNINSVINFSFLPSDSNKLISNKKPSDYFVSIVPEKNRNAILNSNLLPEEDEHYSEDDYLIFLNGRAKKVIRAIYYHSGLVQPAHSEL